MLEVSFMQTHKVLSNMTADSRLSIGCIHAGHGLLDFFPEVKRMLSQLGRLRDIQRVNAQDPWQIIAGGHRYWWTVVGITSVSLHSPESIQKPFCSTCFGNQNGPDTKEIGMVERERAKLNRYCRVRCLPAMRAVVSAGLRLLRISLRWVHHSTQGALIGEGDKKKLADKITMLQEDTDRLEFVCGHSSRICFCCNW